MASTVPVFQKVLGYTTEEAQVLLAEARKEFRDQKVHLYQQCCFCYARKPEDPLSQPLPTRREFRMANDYRKDLFDPGVPVIYLTKVYQDVIAL